MFAADAGDGTLTARGWQPTLGHGPRFIGLDPAGRFLHAANEQSDTVVMFRIDDGTGRLAPTGQAIAIGSPVAVVLGGSAAISSA
jgi:6-phosphogluconolactonase